MKNSILIDNERDQNLSRPARLTLDDRYLLPGESYQQLFARVAGTYADDKEHAQRLYEYISRLWFMPATPILSNGGAERGLPISCFLNEADDTLKGIADLWYENIWLASKGGGIGSYWGNLRSIGETVHRSGKTSGVIPFIKVQDSIIMAISQGSIRPGSAAVYLPIHHPEIEEFLEIRKPTGGDPNRKALNIHHGICIDDDFMRAVESGEMYGLRSPHDGRVLSQISAREVWAKILTLRLETGEPYILFTDAVNRALPEAHRKLKLTVKMSNLCSEITLPTGKDHTGRERTAVCCLSSVNLNYYDEWKTNIVFIEDVMKFLDNVLQDFIDRAPDEMSKARYSAARERSVGLGVMGFHSYLQIKNVPFESATARSINKNIFRHLHAETTKASHRLAIQRGPAPDNKAAGVLGRFVNTMAIAPTASISTIASNASPGIEPYAANAFTQKTLSGSLAVRNPVLDKVIKDKLRTKYALSDSTLHSLVMDEEYNQIWSRITLNEGSIQGDSFFTEDEQLVFKTAIEIDQRWVVQHAADRTEFISQSQSVNLFLPPDVEKRDLHTIHMEAWKKGLKSLYYLRSMSIARAEKSDSVNFKDGEDCLGCQ